MKGSYVLVVELKKDSKIRIGKLGIFDFPKGYYCYVGSALGESVNLENRIGRHKRLNKEKSGNLKWHIDHFLINPVVSIFETITSNEEECRISQMVERLANKTIHGFGSSDCKCDGHFHYFEDKKKVEIVRAKLT